MAQRDKRGKFLPAQKKEETSIMSETNGTAEVKPMLTLSQAVQYLHSFDPKITKQKLKTILESTRNSAIFNPATVKVTHYHPEVPDLIEIDPSALDAFVAAKQSGNVGKRATRAGKPRKYTQYILDSKIVEYQALMEANGFDAAVPAYKAKSATSNTPVVPQDSTAPTDAIEDLITA